LAKDQRAKLKRISKLSRGKLEKLLLGGQGKGARTLPACGLRHLRGGEKNDLSEKGRRGFKGEGTAYKANRKKRLFYHPCKQKVDPYVTGVTGKKGSDRPKKGETFISFMEAKTRFGTAKSKKGWNTKQNFLESVRRLIPPSARRDAPT